jgi:hypothetical protein
MLSWTYHDTASSGIWLTDGRQRMFLATGFVKDFAAWCRGDCDGYNGEPIRQFGHDILVDHDATTITWHGFTDMPVVGRVRMTVRWPREEVSQILRAVIVAERLRGLSESQPPDWYGAVQALPVTLKKRGT